MIIQEAKLFNFDKTSGTLFLYNAEQSFLGETGCALQAS
jgi:hypothetical protein